jgi:hypothetical protein
MNTTPFPIDRTSLLNLQGLYDAFIYDRVSGSYLKKLSSDFRSLQGSHNKGEVFKLYDDLFQASKPEELLTIDRKTNELMSKLMTKFWNFALDPGFTKLDPLDEILLNELINSISAPRTPL